MTVEAQSALDALDRVEQKSGPPYMLAYDFIHGWDKDTRVAQPGWGGIVRESLEIQVALDKMPEGYAASFFRHENGWQCTVGNGRINHVSKRKTASAAILAALDQS